MAADWDASTISAVAALAVSFFALLVAAAQAVQQYFITGQLIRLCDSVVYGPYPGSGRRVWQMSQFRFRVLYTMPSFGLASSLWLHDLDSDEPTESELSDSDVTSTGSGASENTTRYAPWVNTLILWWRRRRGKTLNLDPRAVSETQSSTAGEAAWASFAQAVAPYCSRSWLVTTMECDADRCPSDLVTAPMPVSMRDTAVMALMSGMEVISYSFEEQMLFMHGEIGSITSARHPVLGPILHFTPGKQVLQDCHAFGIKLYPIGFKGQIKKKWLVRTWDACTVANRLYNNLERRRVRRLDTRWYAELRRMDYSIIKSGVAAKMERHLSRKNQAGSDSHNPQPEQGDQLEKTIRVPLVPEYRPQDGDWYFDYLEHRPRNPRRTISPPRIIIPPVNKGPQAENEPVDTVKTSQKSSNSSSSKQHGLPQRRATVEDAPDEANDGGNRPRGSYGSNIIDDIQGGSGGNKGPPDLPFHTKNADSEAGRVRSQREEIAWSRQMQRTERARAIRRDREIVQDSVRAGAMPSPYATDPDKQPLLLTDYEHGRRTRDANAHNSDDPEHRPKLTAKEKAAREREQLRFKQRQERENEREERLRAGGRAVPMGQLDMFWYCQIDISRGTWATCRGYQDSPAYTSLPGAISVVLECLLGFYPGDKITYTKSDPRTLRAFRQTTRWLLEGNITYPAYAINARGGVIASGRYRCVHVPAFGDAPIPVLELLNSHRWQGSPGQYNLNTIGEELNTELMRLDSWLSWVGRLPAVADGPKQLLKSAPSYVHLLMEEFSLDFHMLDLDAHEGGLQDIQKVAANIMDWLLDEDLTDAEQVYVLIAFLRGLKVAQCVLSGPDTTALFRLLHQDVQVHLV